MRKIIAICLVLAISVLTVGLCSCEESNPYPPVESSEEEARVLLTFKANGESYAFRYELFRALFCNLYVRETRSAEEESLYLASLKEKTTSIAAGIFAVIAEAKKIGCDVMGKEGDEFVKDVIADSVGDGSYDEYLQGLSDLSMNYAVADLMYRYSLALSEVDDYYLGSEDESAPTVGKLTYTDADVAAFYSSDECTRVLKAFLPSNSATRASAETFRNKLAEKTSDSDAAFFIVGNTLADGSEIIHAKTKTVSGSLITKYGTESVYFSAVSDAAFALAPGEVSPVIFAAGESQAGYYIICALEKSESYFADFYEEVVSAYLENELGKLLDTAKGEMLQTASEEPLYQKLDLASLVR